jgi:hypothetical protein
MAIPYRLDYAPANDRSLAYQWAEARTVVRWCGGVKKVLLLFRSLKLNISPLNKLHVSFIPSTIHNTIHIPTLFLRVKSSRFLSHSTPFGRAIGKKRSNEWKWQNIQWSHRNVPFLLLLYSLCCKLYGQQVIMTIVITLLSVCPMQKQ